MTLKWLQVLKNYLFTYNRIFTLKTFYHSHR